MLKKRFKDNLQIVIEPFLIINPILKRCLTLLGSKRIQLLIGVEDEDSYQKSGRALLRGL
jgi:hypothetical protein